VSPASTVKSRQVSPIVYRTPRSVWWITTGAALVIYALTVVAFVVGLGGWYRACFLMLCGFSLLAFLELASTRLTIEGETLSFVKTFRTRVFHREDIDSVTWAKGCGVSIKLADGRWVQLPDLGPSPQGLTNTIRAWLKRTAPATSGTGRSD
jgi:hypothetical protein